ncbi:BZ3500_MvSof-1268-A1-R1_Chr12-3g04015 [Microbotryum saponariae]|uniref:BZ3500_MvSof-1268-A1-R1_Chr12-3g04015 protein n=1 Tax=Microbotryum saponariae TaxID=289078 RepID=A0A2X0LTC6_9BASI|nr:BZ3500_MvSof-1268-A1-R1_Chr12-3g04015 [Microbotryum saponariae]SDA02543.1 BZ3501_MvSof-1269-A2-R1_Chr12-3g03670 [Microbotryum saponariae]
MVSFLARLTGAGGPSNNGSGDKDSGRKTPSSSPTKSIRANSNPSSSSSSSKSFIRLPRASTRHQTPAQTAAVLAVPGSPSLASANPLPPLDLPSVNLLEDDGTTIHQAALATGLPTSPLAPRISTSAAGVRSSTETTPWVKLDDSDENASERATLTEHDSHSDLQQRDLTLNVDDQKRLRRAMLTVEDVIVLLKECGVVIRERGLTTLGLFRPYRIGESRLKIDRLALLFYAFALDRSSVHRAADQPRNTNGLFRVGGGKTKGAKLDAFKEEIKYANVHDVVGVLKWGLRHLVYSTSFAGKPSPQPLAWYDNFMLASEVAKHPTTAFSTLLLPSLPPSSQDLLTALLEVMQAVAAFTELNAMSAHRLSRQLGIYLFGLAPRGKAWSDWSELYTTWQNAGNALEGCLRAYVRSQPDLPERLRELVEAYPSPPPRVVKSQLKSVIKVEIEVKAEVWSRVMAVEVNDQRTGLVVALGTGGGAGGRQALSTGGIKRRDPVDILVDAFEAMHDPKLDDVEQGTKDVWKMIIEEAKNDGEPIAILSDETRRVLGLIGLDRGSSTWSTLPLSDDARPQHGRQRSYSHGFESVSPLPRFDFSNLTTPVSGSFPNRSVTHLSPSQLSGAPNRFSNRPSTAPQQASRIVTPNWSEFASTGFSDTVPANEFGLVDLSEGTGDGLRAKTTGGKAKDSRSSMGQRTPVKASSPSRVHSSSTSIKPLRSLLNLSLTQIEDDFADVWLETLSDPGICSSWPSFLIAELQTDLVSSLETKIDHLLITEKLIELRPLSRTTNSSSSASIKGITRSVSVAESTLSKRWRRASQLFSGSGSGFGSGSGKDGGSTSGHSTPTAPSPVTSPRQSRISVGKKSMTSPQPETIVEQARGNSVDLKATAMLASGATTTTAAVVVVATSPEKEPAQSSMASVDPETTTTVGDQFRRVPEATGVPVKDTVEPTPPTIEEPTLTDTQVEPIVEAETVPPVLTPAPTIVVDEAPELSEDRAKVEVTSELQPEAEVVEPPAPAVSEDPTAVLPPSTADDSIIEALKKLGDAPNDENPVVPGLRAEEALAPHNGLNAVHGDQAGEQTEGPHSQSVEDLEAPVPHQRSNPAHDDLEGGQIGNQQGNPNPQSVSSLSAVHDGSVNPTHGDHTGQEIGVARPASVEGVDVAALSDRKAETVSKTEATTSLVSSVALPAEGPVVNEQSEMVEKEAGVDSSNPSSCGDSLSVLESEVMRVRTLSQASSSTIGATPSKDSSPGSTTSKRFLGGMSDMLRRKTSAEKAQAKLEKEEEKKTQRELRQLKDEEKLSNSNRNRETKVPTPVSSVRARVLELEAERAKAEASVESPIRRSISGSFPGMTRSESGGMASPLSSSPESPTLARRSLKMPSKIATLAEGASIATVAGDAAAVAVASGVSASPQPQESQHLAVKAPKTLDQLPSPLPSPTPVLEEECSTPLLATDPTPDSTAVFDHHPPQLDFGEVASPTSPSSMNVAPPTPIKGNDPFIADSNGTPRAKPPLFAGHKEPSLDVEPDLSILQPSPATTVEATTAEEVEQDSHSFDHPPASLPSSASDYSIAETATSFKTADSDAFFET